MALPWMRHMQARSADEQHRAATPLELFFDLCFVVAVAQAASSLHHGVTAGHLSDGFTRYPLVFFAVWWAWMNFTWFSSAYDTDDVVYRLATLTQIAGVLILAAGIPRAFDEADFGVVTLGYAVMRTALIAQWLRAAGSDPDRRPTDVRYAVGVGVCMVGWILLLFLPDGPRALGFLVMIAAELAVPVWAERPAVTPWHPRHIAERYGLFTLIVLGETVLAATIAVQAALDAGEALGQLAAVAVGGLLIVFSMWWLYFSQPADAVVGRARMAFDEAASSEPFIWGYGHYFVFASAAAVGAGLAAVVDQVTQHAAVSARGALMAVAVPVALFVLSVWVLHHRTVWSTRLVDAAYPMAAALVVLAAWLAAPVWVVGLILVVLVSVTTASIDH